MAAQNRNRLTGKNFRGSSRLGAVAVGLLAAGTVAGTLAAPAQADAELTGIGITTRAGYGLGNGSSNNAYGTNCTYKLAVMVSEPKDADSALKVVSTSGTRSVTLYDRKPTTERTTVEWTPQQTGRYTLTATLNGESRSLSVTVAPGFPLPDFIRRGSCVVPWG